jgi:hypothetical protein
MLNHRTPARNTITSDQVPTAAVSGNPNQSCSRIINWSGDYPCSRCRVVHLYQRMPFCVVGIRVLRLLRQHLPDLLVAQVDLVHRVAALLEWHVVVVAERWHEDLGIPDEALTGREVGDQSQGPLGAVSNLDGRTFLLRERGAQQARPSGMQRLLIMRRPRRRLWLWRTRRARVRRG